MRACGAHMAHNIKLCVFRSKRCKSTLHQIGRFGICATLRTNWAQKQLKRVRIHGVIADRVWGLLPLSVEIAHIFGLDTAQNRKYHAI